MAVDACGVDLQGASVERHCKTVARSGHNHVPRPAADFHLVLHRLTATPPPAPGRASDAAVRSRRGRRAGARQRRPRALPAGPPAGAEPFDKVDGDNTAWSAAATAATSSTWDVGWTNGRPLRAFSTSSRYVV